MRETVAEKNKNQRPLRVRDSDRCRRAFLRASLTVEAAFALPLVIFASVMLMIPMKVIDVHRRMQMTCEGICADVCKYAYSAEYTEDDSPLPYMSESGALGIYAAARAEEAAGDSDMRIISSIDTECLVDGETVTIMLDYQYAVPFSFIIPETISHTVVSSRRAWIGARGPGSEACDGGMETDEIYVYVGKNSSVSHTYHLSADCSYLVHIFSAGSASDAEASGYKPCSRCCRNGTSGSVWVTDGGGKYHNDRDCSSMNSYARQVRLSEIPGYHPCGRCGGKK